MKRKNAIRNSFLYKHRYIAAVVMLSLVAVFMAVYRFWDLPAGLSSAEMRAATVSGHLSLGGLMSDPSQLINLPWSILQCLSIKLFGLSVLSITLPAVILTLITVGLIILLLQKITKPSLAIMGGLLTVSSSFAIGMTRAGVPAAMATLLLTLILLAGYRAINHDDENQYRSFIGLAIASGLLCYMQAGVYIVLAMGIIAFAHPRLRLAVRANKKRLTLTLATFGVVVLPLLAGVIIDAINGRVDLLADLFIIGTPSLNNLVVFAKSFAGFEPNVLGGLVVPMLTVVGSIMAVIGLIVAALDKSSSVRFYLLLGLIVAITAMGVFEPGLVYLLFIPTVILETLCLGYITDKWYSLFPVNPYARVFAILPLAILLGSLSSVDMSRFFNAINYDANVVYSFDHSLPAVNDVMAAKKGDGYNYTIVASGKNESFYQLLGDDVKVVTDQASVDDWVANKSQGDRLIVLSDATVNIPKTAELTNLRTNQWSRDGLVLMEYRP